MAVISNDKGQPAVARVVSNEPGQLVSVKFGYASQLPQNRSVWTVLGMGLSIAAVPYGIGGPLISAIYGGGQLSIFIGLLVVMVLDICVAVSLGELASRYPTSSGTYYWSYRLMGESSWKKALSYTTGWFWLIGNWTITLSVNFGFASLIAATVSIYQPEWTATTWELLLIFYAICIISLVNCALGDRFLPYVDAAAAIWNLITIIAVLLALSITAKSGRHSASYGLGHYDTSFSGWGHGFTFFIGLLPSAYTFSALGMVVSMAEECTKPEFEVPRAMALSIPVGGIAAIFYVLPICFTLPPLEDVLEAPYGQVLPYIFEQVIGNKGGALVLMLMVLLVTLFCSISITTSASRCTWAFSRDHGIPMSKLWSTTTAERPLWALVLVTVVEMLLGLVYLGSSSAFTAFVSVGVIALAAAYFVPIFISLCQGRSEVAKAPWNLGQPLGIVANVLALAWIVFELVLFSMPTVLPVNSVTMNYASVVFVGLSMISVVWYMFKGKTEYNGPPEEFI